MKKPLIFLTCFLTCFLVYPQITFERTYGGTYFDTGKSITQTSDNGYLIAGAKEDSFGTDHVWLIKTNELGDTLWTKIFGENYNSSGYSVAQTSDGGYIIAGSKNITLVGDVLLIRTDANGDTLWTRTFGSAFDDRGYSVAQTNDGGFIITGITSINGTQLDVYLIKTDTNGYIVWTKTFGGNDYDMSYSVAQTSDSGFIISGITGSFGAGFSDVFLIKTDAIGDTLWTKTYGGAYNDESVSLAKTYDGGYLITGGTESFGVGNYDVYLIKTDANGDTIWTKTFGGFGYDYGSCVKQTNDGGYIITGGTNSFEAGNYDVYLIKTDANGDTIWTNTFGGVDGDWGYCVIQTNDGGYIITGETNSFGAGSSDIYLIKIDVNGHVVGIDENASTTNDGVNIFPNPSSISINILIPQQFGQIKTLEIYSCLGQLQLVKLDDFSKIDISSLSNGLYFIVLTNFENERLSKGIIKE